MKETIETTLAERQKTHGHFSNVAKDAQTAKVSLRKHRGWDRLSCIQKESLENIACKISRILNGDSSNEDSWIDIAGYATLAVRENQESKLGPF